MYRAYIRALSEDNRHGLPTITKKEYKTFNGAINFLLRWAHANKIPLREIEKQSEKKEPFFLQIDNIGFGVHFIK